MKNIKLSRFALVMLLGIHVNRNMLKVVATGNEDGGVEQSPYVLEFQQFQGSLDCIGESPHVSIFDSSNVCMDWGTLVPEGVQLLQNDVVIADGILSTQIDCTPGSRSISYSTLTNTECDEGEITDDGDFEDVKIVFTNLEMCMQASCVLRTDSPSTAPSQQPSLSPIIPKSPSLSPVTSKPSRAPSRTPSSVPSKSPSKTPSKVPSFAPSMSPTGAPVTQRPSNAPSHVPSTSRPSSTPSRVPSSFDIENPVPAPSTSPSDAPTVFSGASLVGSLLSIYITFVFWIIVLVV